MKNYMKDHPEITAIEYEGELRTPEDLDALWNEMLDDMFAEEEYEEEMLTEELTEEAVIMQ